MQLQPVILAGSLFTSVISQSLMAATAWAATSAARRRFAARLAAGQYAEPAQHNAANLLAGFRVLGEWRGIHVLFNFEIARLFAVFPGNGFVNVGGHVPS